MDRDDVQVPRELLLPVLARLEQRAAKERRYAWPFASGLVLYARNPDKLAGRRFRLLLRSDDETIAGAAARGLEILAGIRPGDRASAAFERGFGRMTKPQQYFYAVAEYSAEVKNGGHRQYFYNSTGERYETAIEGLRASGARSGARVLSQALRAFAPSSPAPDTSERREQMELFGNLQESILSRADDRFYRLEEHPRLRLDVLLTLYAVKHRKDFLRPADSSD